MITCAAPNLRNIKSSDYNSAELLEIHKNRSKHILHITALNNVDILISGTFGCGAYRNDPEIVAEAWKEALKIYQKKFDYIIFAIFFRDYEINNFKIFNEKFSLT